MSEIPADTTGREERLTACRTVRARSLLARGSLHIGGCTGSLATVNMGGPS